MEKQPKNLLSTLGPHHKQNMAIKDQQMLYLIILWEQSQSRIGEHAVIDTSKSTSFNVSRFAPLFSRHNETSKLALSDLAISRSPIQIQKITQSNYKITVPESPMKVWVNGLAVNSCVDVDLTVDDIITLNISNRLLLGISLLPLDQVGDTTSIIGISPAINISRRKILEVARSDVTVMIRGETGTGKELCARSIHNHSYRQSSQFIPLNMAVIPHNLAASELFGAKKGAYTGLTKTKTGFFEQASGGTLFCDEIGDTPATIQPMILRAIEEQEITPLGNMGVTKINVRFVSATDRNIEDMNNFNQPLYHRLAAFEIIMPPLRNRKIDIPILLDHFLKQSRNVQVENAGKNLDIKTIENLICYEWPGNVRELKNIADRIALGMFTIDDIVSKSEKYPVLQTRLRSASSVSDTELLEAFEVCEWLIKPTAKRLNVSRTALYERLKSTSVIKQINELSDQEIHMAKPDDDNDYKTWASNLKTPQGALKRRLKRLSDIS